MKDTDFLYTIVILAAVAIVAVFVGYATETLPTNTPRQAATTPTGNVSNKAEKGCNCCKESLAKFREFMEMRERRKAATQAKIEVQDATAE